jgi:hypothetical protein
MRHQGRGGGNADVALLAPRNGLQIADCIVEFPQNPISNPFEPSRISGQFDTPGSSVKELQTSGYLELLNGCGQRRLRLEQAAGGKRKRSSFGNRNKASKMPK